MAFDWHAHLRETAQWLVEMSEIPGARKHAEHRRDELLANPMYAEALRAELNRLQQQKPKG